MNVPKLRFPGFTDEWQATRIGSVATKVGSGSTPTGGSKVYTKSGVPFIRSQNVVNGRLELKDVAYIDEATHKSMSNSKVESDDVLLNITGASLGRTCVVPPDFISGNVNQHACIIRLQENTNPYFIHMILSQPKSLHRLLQTQTGGGKEGLNFQAVRTFRLYLPAAKEQQKIADFLTTVDKKIESIDKKVELLKQYKKGVMQKIFSQEIRFKDEDGGEYPEWEEKKLGDIATFSKGANISKDDISPEGRTPAIRYGELYTTYNEVIDEVKSRTNLPTSSLVLSRQNDIIIPASGETHIDIATASCVLHDSIALSGDINIIRSKHNGVFLAHYLNNKKRKEIARRAQGVSVVHLYSTNLKDLPINLPPIGEQQKIADFLSSIDAKIQAEETKLASAKKFKKALLQQMFV